IAQMGSSGSASSGGSTSSSGTGNTSGGSAGMPGDGDGTAVDAHSGSDSINRPSGGTATQPPGQRTEGKGSRSAPPRTHTTPFHAGVSGEGDTSRPIGTSAGVITDPAANGTVNADTDTDTGTTRTQATINEDNNISAKVRKALSDGSTDAGFNARNVTV